jgi:GntR family transcriptional regulator, transcriptional repressor for pyruvate dehydrogenase complex
MIGEDTTGAASVTFDRPPLYEQVLSHMTGLITRGEWPAGAPLPPEGELARQFKVSRTVIRECVRVLASRGMVNVRQGRNIYVTPHENWKATESLALLVRSDHASLMYWLEVRTLLELDCVGLAAERAGEDDLAELAALIAQQSDCEDDPVAYRTLDIRFHLGIARATHNPALLRLAEGVIQPLREQMEERVLTPETRHASTAEHREILARLRERDAAGARRALAAQLGRVADEITQVLESQASA